MKRTSLAVAALLTTLSSATLIPVAFADDVTTTSQVSSCTGDKPCSASKDETTTTTTTTQCKACSACKAAKQDSNDTKDNSDTSGN